MIDYTEIEKTLIESEANYDTSFAALAKLAPLYSALLYKRISGNSAKSEPLALSGDSDFMRSIAQKDSGEVFAVIDELMTTLQTLQPRLYQSVMRRLDGLSS